MLNEFRPMTDILHPIRLCHKGAQAPRDIIITPRSSTIYMKCRCAVCVVGAVHVAGCMERNNASADLWECPPSKSDPGTSMTMRRKFVPTSITKGRYKCARKACKHGETDPLFPSFTGVLNDGTGPFAHIFVLVPFPFAFFISHLFMLEWCRTFFPSRCSATFPMPESGYPNKLAPLLVLCSFGHFKPSQRLPSVGKVTHVSVIFALEQ